MEINTVKYGHTHQVLLYGLCIQELQLTELLFKKSDVLGKTLSLPHQILTYIYNYQKSKINNS